MMHKEIDGKNIKNFMKTLKTGIDSCRLEQKSEQKHG